VNLPKTPIASNFNVSFRCFGNHGCSRWRNVCSILIGSLQLAVLMSTELKVAGKCLCRYKTVIGCSRLPIGLSYETNDCTEWSC